MAREIKFRLWNPERKILTGGAELSTLLMTTDMDFVTAFHQKQMVWMQYTGLKDKNGKEIYESDIVSYGTTTEYNRLIVFEVMWHIDRWRVGTKKNYAPVAIGQSQWAKLEVIGNIYENPELLNTNTQQS